MPCTRKMLRMLLSFAPIALRSAISRFFSITNMISVAITLKAATIVLEAMTGLTLKVGGSVVDLKAATVDIVGGMVKVNSGGGGGSAKAASPTAPAEAKKEASIAPDKKADYNKTFDDPMPADQGGTGPAEES